MPGRYRPVVPSPVLLAAVLALLAIFVLRLCDTVPGNSVTYDESVHVTRGYAALKLHDSRLSIEHPVLGDALLAIPLVFDRSIRFPRQSEAWKEAAHWVIADLFLWHTNRNPQSIVNRSRYVVVGLGTVLGALVAFWAFELYGTWGCLLALLLYTVSPTVLANSSLATNDLSLTLFSTLFLWSLWWFMRRPGWGRGTVTAILLGAAIMSKYSGLVLFVDLVLLIAWWTIHSHRVDRALPGGSRPNGGDSPKEPSGRVAPAGSYRSAALQGLGILLGAMLVVWVVYGLRVQPLATPSAMRFEVGEAFDQFIRKHSPRGDDVLIRSPGDATRKAPPLPHNLRWKVLTRVPVPAPQYFRGLAENLMQARGGHRAYLLGRVSRRGWWYYFPVASVVKTPIPFLLLLALAAATAVLGSGEFGWEWDEWILLLPVAVLFLTAMKAHIDIGIRHLLPIYPLLAIFCGRLPGVVSRFPRAREKWIAFAALACLAAWSVVETACIHPFYLTYFNEAAGGPEGGSRIVVDSNLDWGQDLIRFSGELRRRRLNKGIGFAYFGSAEPGAYGILFQPLDPEPAHRRATGRLPLYGWVAVSVSEQAYFGGPGGGLHWLAPFRPVFTVGHTIRVYHLALPPVKHSEARKAAHAETQKSLHGDQVLE